MQYGIVLRDHSVNVELRSRLIRFPALPVFRWRWRFVRPGAPQQLNHLVGVFFAFFSWASLVAGYTIGAYIMLASISRLFPGDVKVTHCLASAV